VRLVTGANGFIGSSIVTEYGDEAIALSRHATDIAGKSQIVCDISQPGSASSLIEQLRPYEITEVIHTAAVTPWATEPDFSIDLIMAETLSEVCNTLQVPRLVFLSGWIVYDMTEGQPPFGEDTPLGPTTPYGQSKLAVERYFTEHLQDTVFVAARLASVYGPGQTSAGLIPNFVAAALEGKELLVASRETRRDYLYIDDLTTALQQLSTQPVTEHTAINIGSGTSVTVLEVAQTIAQLCNSLYKQQVPIVRPTPATEATPRNNQLDITKARSLGALDSPTALQNGLRTFVQWKNQ
jgi:nucleoside-diphosphate-sugar epimerase